MCLYYYLYVIAARVNTPMVSMAMVDCCGTSSYLCYGCLVLMAMCVLTTSCTYIITYVTIYIHISI